ncbi:chalcone isomerase family protein [Roseateles toxinivorans]|uniref:Chalcone isomerase-like protein n=1 Tax=Roseateles toxinivorans TaxID=270368 RepID=A0A4V3CU10_9BURK|nr:chalcone isomerase family protein [Roseateles toxinivorans]TDP74898.1 chalcone isomerase-like protein [Roseateles toxinivorans]
MRKCLDVNKGRRGLLLAAMGATGLMATPAWALQYEGFDVPESVTLGGVPLVLNGVGMRAVAVLKGYSAALYLSGKSQQPSEVLANTGPKRVQIRMLLQISVGAEEFVKAINKGVQRNCTEAERLAVADRVAQLNANLRRIGKVSRKDLINLDYLPDSGLVLSVNGKVSGDPLPGADLYGAILKVFLGERPVDRRLKAGMLGLPVQELRST